MDAIENQFNKNKFTLTYYSKDIEKNYLEAVAKNKKTQMLFIMSLTFSLYVLYIAVDFFTLGNEKSMSIYFHSSMLVFWIYLLVTTYYEMHKVFSQLIIYLLPVYAVAMTLGIAYFTTPVYITEVYIILFWVFLAIGYTFFESLIIGTKIALISIVMTFALNMLSFENFLVHLFYVVAAWALGTLAGYRLELSSRNTYEQNIEILSIKNELENINQNLEKKIVAESEKATKEITDQASDLRRAQKLAKVGSWRYKIKEDILRWSDETYEIFQIDKNVYPIKKLNDFFSRVNDAYMKKVKNAYEAHLNDGTPYKLVHKLVLDDGTIKWIQEECDTFYDDDGIPVVSNGILQDITHIKEQEISLLDARVQAEESAVAKSEFLASMSHEIRTPLNAILGFVTILKKTIQEEKSKNYLEIIDSSGKSLLAIINDILDFSKMQSGKFDIDKHPVVPAEEFARTVKLFASNAYAKFHIYSTYIDPKLPRSINVDAVRVNQILSNLLSNAIKFTPRYGSLGVRVTYEDASLIISVKDSGIGIAKENLSKIFSAFSQADGSTTRKYGGTGLGLSISSLLAELMGGRLVVESEENNGATFTLKLPAELIDEEPLEFISNDAIPTLRVAILNNTPAHEESVSLVERYLCDFGITSILKLSEYQADGYDVLFFVPDDTYNDAVVEAKTPAVVMFNDDAIDVNHLEHITPVYTPFIPRCIIDALSEVVPKSVKPKTTMEETLTDEDEITFKGNILVAEDNVTNQMLIKLLLTDYGIKFKIANDGIEAVDIFKEGKFDMVLMDENMPNKNGIEAMIEIKAYEDENSLVTTPIVALTANALETDKERFRSAGMDGFIAKPIDIKALEMELSKHLVKL